MRAVIYCRVSTQQQTKNLSLPAQRKECVKFCKAQGWTVDRVFVERGESAKSADRTELTRLLDYCRDKLEPAVLGLKPQATRLGPFGAVKRRMPHRRVKTPGYTPRPLRGRKGKTPSRRG